MSKQEKYSRSAIPGSGKKPKTETSKRNTLQQSEGFKITAECEKLLTSAFDPAGYDRNSMRPLRERLFARKNPNVRGMTLQDSMKQKAAEEAVFCPCGCQTILRASEDLKGVLMLDLQALGKPF
ncbi:hypothetical protein GBAR_LOCUS8148 [Geodia barretti]|uniref:Uncharacterized protein n=1 Tax=Geodia barretti TaxID=519541 RepID=A0AA35RJN2_GEOBA|nr:hypothetical protein GBAR_LOCUS8148 [Geodia barretti]